MAGLTCESFLTAPRLAGVFKNPDFGDARWGGWGLRKMGLCVVCAVGVVCVGWGVRCSCDGVDGRGGGLENRDGAGRAGWDV